MAEYETIFDRWAKERNITVKEMKAIIFPKWGIE